MKKSFKINQYILSLIVIFACGLNSPAAEEIFTKEKGGWRHTGNYQAPSIAWKPELNVPNVRDVVPHPQADAVAAAICDDALYLTTDNGDTWQKAMGINKDLAESVTFLSFQDNKSSNFLLGTKNKGIWFSKDYGKTIKPLAKKSNGLASDYIESVYFQKVDMSFNTILACHGEKSTGISRSTDGGKTWQVMYPKLHFFRLYQGRIGTQAMYMLGADQEEPDVQNIYSISSLGKYWRRALRDLLVNDAITDPKGEDLFLATVDGGLICIHRYGSSIEKFGHDNFEWNSIGRSWYNTADSTQMFLYEPEKFGFAQSLDKLKNIRSLGKGPYKGKIVQEGAQIRSATGGAVYFAAVNGTLYIGKNSNPHRVDKVNISPPTINISQSVFIGEHWRKIEQELEDFAKSKHSKDQLDILCRQFKTFAKALGTPELKIRSKITSEKSTTDKVTVDLSRIGGSHATPMYDDGKHDDGKAGDGIYGTIFPVQHTILSRPHNSDWRTRWPGSIGLTVTAQSANGKLAGGVGSLGIFIKPESFYFWNGGYKHTWASPGAKFYRHQKWVRNKKGGNKREEWLVFQTCAGTWRIKLSGDYNNISNYYALGFEIMPMQDAVEDIQLKLQDQPFFTAPGYTSPELVSSGKNVQGGKLIKGKWNKVYVPLGKLLKEAEDFVPEIFAHIHLSGNDKSSKQYRLHKIKFFRNKQDLQKWLEDKE